MKAITTVNKSLYPKGIQDSGSTVTQTCVTQHRLHDWDLALPLKSLQETNHKQLS